MIKVLPHLTMKCKIYIYTICNVIVFCLNKIWSCEIWPFQQILLTSLETPNIFHPYDGSSIALNSVSIYIWHDFSITYTLQFLLFTLDCLPYSAISKNCNEQEYASFLFIYLNCFTSTICHILERLRCFNNRKFHLNSPSWADQLC